MNAGEEEGMIKKWKERMRERERERDGGRHKNKTNNKIKGVRCLESFF